MEIINELSEEKFYEIDDLLAFISIYDDQNRFRGYLQLIEILEENIRGAVCLEAGCGFGLFSEEMARRGARKVYAVEANPSLFEIAKKRLHKYPNIELILSDIRDFIPEDPVDILLHDFFGQLLYDEDLFVLDSLRFKPARIVPNWAVLKGGLTFSRKMVDSTVTQQVLKKLQGVLVSGLFDEQNLPLQFSILEWLPAKPNYHTKFNLSDYEGDLLYFGIQIFQDDQLLCQSGICENWSYIWTPRAGNIFELQFTPDKQGMKVYFNWIG